MSYTYDEKSTDSYHFIGGIQQDLLHLLNVFKKTKTSNIMKTSNILNLAKIIDFLKIPMNTNHL